MWFFIIFCEECCYLTDQMDMEIGWREMGVQVFEAGEGGGNCEQNKIDPIIFSVAACNQ